MPIYEYLCGKCDHEFEREQRITDPPLKTCPECRSRKLKKLISRTSFVLKGSGWYSDLYSSSKSKKGGKDSTESESKSSDTKSEGKPSDSKERKEKSSKQSPPAASKPKKGKSAA